MIDSILQDQQLTSTSWSCSTPTSSTRAVTHTLSGSVTTRDSKANGTAIGSRGTIVKRSSVVRTIN